MQMEAFNKELFIRDYFQGLNDAMKAGHEEGTAVGLAKGKAEASLVIARTMLADGVPLEAVAKYTGLMIEEVSLLKK